VTVQLAVIRILSSVWMQKLLQQSISEILLLSLLLEDLMLLLLLLIFAYLKQLHCIIIFHVFKIATFAFFTCSGLVMRNTSPLARPFAHLSPLRI
jgi:Kef-type K+ transport system membrane component KefB